MTWQAVLEDDGRPMFRIGRAGGDLLAEWTGLATLRAHRADGSSELVFEEGIDPRWCKKLERGLVRGMLGQLGGKLTLHASAVANDERALLIVGKSGAGKSTLAGVLAKSHGLRVAADDASPISFGESRAWVEPADSEVWLWSESRRALGLDATGDRKEPMLAPLSAITACRIEAIVVPVFADVASPTLRPLRGHEALEPLLAAVVRLVIDEREVQLREIADLEKLVSVAPVYELARTRDLSRIGASAETLSRLLDGERA